MPANTFYIYTDASFSKVRLFAVSAFLVFRNDEEHEAGVPPLSLIRTFSFNEKTNIRAELRGMLLALESIVVEVKQIHQERPKEKLEIKLFTDCQTAIQLLLRREKLEATGFVSQRKKEILPNADLYRQFFILYDQIRPEMIWVKGHSPKRGHGWMQKNFGALDKIVRKELRAKVLMDSGHLDK
jgi:ribonuclease HI